MPFISQRFQSIAPWAKPQFLHLLVGHGHRPDDRAGPGLVVLALLILRSGSRDKGEKTMGNNHAKKTNKLGNHILNCLTCPILFVGFLFSFVFFLISAWEGAFQALCECYPSESSQLDFGHSTKSEWQWHGLQRWNPAVEWMLAVFIHYDIYN